MKLSSINNSISSINLGGINQTNAKNIKPSLQMPPDTFIKSSNISFQGSNYITLPEKNKPTDEMTEHIKTLEDKEPLKMRKYSSKLDELTAKRSELTDEASKIQQELLALYKNKAKKTQDGRNVEIQNAALVECDENGKAKREAVFKEDEAQAARKFFKRKNGSKLKNPKLALMVEHNQDGTINIISNDTYFKNYKKNKDGSTSFEQAAAFGPTKRNPKKLEIRYGRGYTQDTKGNKHWDEALYNQCAATPFGIYESMNTYRKNENITPNGNITADVHHNFNIASMGTPAQYYYEGYEEKGDKTSYKKGVTVWCDELYEYKENYKENENGKKEWDVYYQKDDGHTNSKTKGQWFNITPDYMKL